MPQVHDDQNAERKLDQTLRALFNQVEQEQVSDSITNLAEKLNSALQDQAKERRAYG